MSAQVVETILPFDLSPARLNRRGQLTLLSYRFIRALRGTRTGTFNNDY